MTGEFVTITIQKMAFSIRKAMPTIEKWFLPPAERLLPPAERLLPPPNGSYRRRAVRTDRRTVRTVAERFVPPPSRSYRRRTVRTNRRTICTVAEPFVPIAEPFLPPKSSFPLSAPAIHRWTMELRSMKWALVRSLAASVVRKIHVSLFG